MTLTLTFSSSITGHQIEYGRLLIVLALRIIVQQLHILSRTATKKRQISRDKLDILTELNVSQEAQAHDSWRFTIEYMLLNYTKNLYFYIL